MKYLTIAFLVLLLMLPPGAVAAAEGTPAGYIVEVKLAGADVQSKTSVVRDGQEIAARLLMPVFAGDTVFVRDGGSSIGIELDAGEIVAVGGTRLRYDVTGEIDTGDGTWSLIAAVGDALGGGNDARVPDNMASKGDDGALAMPLAIRGANRVVRGESRLWLGWTGGVAPFSVEIDGEEERIKVQSRATVVAIPQTANRRFGISVTDANGHRVALRFRVAESLPAPPPNTSSKASRVAQRLALAAWLSQQDNGEWRVAAAQLLDGEEGSAAFALRDALRRGWPFP